MLYETLWASLGALVAWEGGEYPPIKLWTMSPPDKVIKGINAPLTWGTEKPHHSVIHQRYDMEGSSKPRMGSKIILTTIMIYYS